MYTHHKFDHEFPRGTATVTSYMVCSVPRCGSSLLCELLCNTGIAGAPTEFFDQEQMEGFRARWGSFSLADYVRDLKDRKTSPNGVFGIKVHWGQLEPALGGADPAGVFPGLRYVHMRREDQLRQAISWVRALQTSQWASSHAARGEPVFDRRQIDLCLERIRTEDACWETFFARRALTPHRVLYERLVAEPERAVAEVLGFLGVAPSTGPPPAPLELEQQADDLTEDWIARYASP